MRRLVTTAVTLRLPPQGHCQRLAVLKSGDAGVHYRLASTLARLNRKTSMLAALEQAISLDRISVRALKDPAFKRFHSDPALLALCQPPPPDL